MDGCQYRRLSERQRIDEQHSPGEKGSHGADRRQARPEAEGPRRSRLPGSVARGEQERARSRRGRGEKSSRTSRGSEDQGHHRTIRLIVESVPSPKPLAIGRRRATAARAEHASEARRACTGASIRCRQRSERLEMARGRMRCTTGDLGVEAKSRRVRRHQDAAAHPGMPTRTRRGGRRGRDARSSRLAGNRARRSKGRTVERRQACTASQPVQKAGAGARSASAATSSCERPYQRHPSRVVRRASRGQHDHTDEIRGARGTAVLERSIAEAELASAKYASTAGRSADRARVRRRACSAKQPDEPLPAGDTNSGRPDRMPIVCLVERGARRSR